VNERENILDFVRVKRKREHEEGLGVDPNFLNDLDDYKDEDYFVDEDFEVKPFKLYEIEGKDKKPPNDKGIKRRKSVKRKSVKRKSVKRKSVKRKSVKRKSIKRKSVKRKLVKRKSCKRK